ncbi:MAG: prepilin peptidase [Planctomycetaceae bacterium]
MNGVLQWHSLAQLSVADMAVRFDLPNWLLLGFVFVLGTIVGSFLNVCVYRLPQHERLWDSLTGLVSPPSSCPRCRTEIAWYDNVPVMGWLLLRGRCRVCKMWISPQYPIIEFLNGLLFLAVFLLEVPLGIGGTLADSCLFTTMGPETIPGLGSLSPEIFLLLRYAFHMVLIEALLVASLIDIRLMIIPDGSTLPAMVFAVIAAASVGRLHLLPVWFQSPRIASDFAETLPAFLSWMLFDGPRVPEWISTSPHWHGLVASVVGLLVGGGVVWCVRVIGGFILRREAMGDGDVVLMAMVGAFVGWQPVLIAFFLAPVAALVVVAVRFAFRRDQMIPYGPYLSLATLIVILCWSRIWPGFERLFNTGTLLILLMVIGTVLFAGILLLMQGAKWLLGIPLGGEDEEVLGWFAADQNHYLAGEKQDRFTGIWRQEDWPGNSSGRGAAFNDRWRYGR